MKFVRCTDLTMQGLEGCPRVGDVVKVVGECEKFYRLEGYAGNWYKWRFEELPEAPDEKPTEVFHSYHPGPYEKLGSEIGKLVEEKQRSYGNSFGRSGEVLRVLFPNGIKPEQYDSALFITRVLDKLFRIATHGTKDPMKESPARDIAGYALLETMRAESPSKPQSTT